MRREKYNNDISTEIRIEYEILIEKWKGKGKVCDLNVVHKPVNSHWPLAINGILVFRIFNL